MQRHTKGIMLSSVGGVFTFDWDADRISYDSMKIYLDDVEFIWKLQDDTIRCLLCKKRKIIDVRLDGIEYCACTKESLRNSIARTSKEALITTSTTLKPWMPYLERKNMIVWRREEKPGLYAYKGNLFLKW